MRTPAQFYYKPDDPFGSPRPGTGRTHRGADWAYPAGTPIPSWISGTVVFNDWYGELGWVLAAKRADGLVAGWCHLEERSSLPVGSRLAYGAYIGADTGDTGSASTGPHLHGTASWSSINPGAGEVVDPWPLILQSLTLTQGEEEMQHWIHPPTGKEILADPVRMEYRFLSTWEKAYLRERGSVAQPLSDPEWTQTFGPYREIKKPDQPAGGSVSIDYVKLAEAIKASGALDLVIAGTARPAGVKK